MTKTALTTQTIERAIHSLRGHRIMLDQDLATLYKVTTGNLNLAVRRNSKRFPSDFMFQTTEEEASLILQTARAKGRGGRHTPPYAFTEQGVAMLSSVLRSARAVEVNIEIMRAFVRLRHILASNADLARKLDALEAKLTRKQDESAKQHAEHEKHFRIVFDAIRQLMAGSGSGEEPNKIGFEIK